MDTSSQTPPVPQAGRREWLGLAVLALPTLLLSIDLSVLYLALPHLSSDLGASAVQQLWIMDIYAFMLAGFLITMGTLGDRIGRRRLLLIGAVAFGLSSVLAAYSATPEMLIAARALLGVAGATLMPSSLALITTMFKDPKQRAAAIGAWMSCLMGGMAVGPVVGGVTLEFFWWGAVFLLGVPVMLLLLVAGPLLLPESRTPETGRIDLLSVALSLAAILPIIYGIKEVAEDGWSLLAGSAILVGVFCGAVFVRRQYGLADPLLDLRLLNIGIYRSAFTLSLLVGAIQGGTLLLINLYLQMVLGFSPLRAGLWLVPTAFAMIVMTMLAPAVARRVRPAYVIMVGLLTSAAGYLVLTLIDSTGGLPALVVGVAIIMAGIGPATSLGYDMILGAVPSEKAGSASALTETGGQFGVALGIAVLGSVSTALYRAQMAVSLPADLPAEAAEAAREGIPGAVAAAQQLPSELGEALLAAAREAFTGGLHTIVLFGSLLFVALAVLAVTTLRTVPPSGQGQTAPDSASPSAASTAS
ncbi:MFS transporter [Thermobifida halotolerans]|uniref:MFS transporter n=1 Tax=Thermobifida halotolerans TaxID=483545 RepID=A0A399G3C2_9ACTN|nr:MFS transporter [Thermobifida halotolerans]UOE21133.1 MFS transporter [Thermobifida halotolerans]